MYKRRRSSRARYARKTSKKYSPRAARGSTRTRRYKKFSRRRTTWTKGTTVSPYRKFVYNDEDYSFSLTTLAPVTWKLFRGNGPYDPDYDVGGVQPYGFDQLCPAFYQLYNVKASKITVYPFVGLTSTSLPSRVKIVVVPYFDTTIPYTEYSDIIQMPFAKSALLTNSSNDNKTCKVSSYASTRAILGKARASDEDSASMYNSNPINPWYWFIFCYSAEAVPAGETYVVRYDVKIAYYTALSQKVCIDNS